MDSKLLYVKEFFNNRYGENTYIPSGRRSGFISIAGYVVALIESAETEVGVEIICHPRACCSPKVSMLFTMDLSDCVDFLIGEYFDFNPDLRGPDMILNGAEAQKYAADHIHDAWFRKEPELDPVQIQESSEDSFDDYFPEYDEALAQIRYEGKRPKRTH